MLSLISFLFGPIGRYLLIAVAAAGLYGYWDLHIRSLERAKILHEQAIERQHATDKANAARSRIDIIFGTHGLRDDGFARDRRRTVRCTITPPVVPQRHPKDAKTSR